MPKTRPNKGKATGKGRPFRLNPLWLLVILGLAAAGLYAALGQSGEQQTPPAPPETQRPAPDQANQAQTPADPPGQGNAPVSAPGHTPAGPNSATATAGTDAAGSPADLPGQALPEQALPGQALPGQTQLQDQTQTPNIFSPASLEDTCAALARRFAGQVPQAWGDSLPGVYTRLAPSTDGRVRVALTLDACGGGAGNAVDLNIINLLEELNIPATLFLNARWINANPDVAARLAGNPLFELENHGLRHKPLSVNGRSIYGLSGTDSPAAAAREVEGGALRLKQLTGQRPLFFRSGTAHYDDVALKIIAALGYKAAGFSVIGDAGGTLPAAKVAALLRAVRDGDIVILHFNRPQSGTYEGLRQALPKLLKRNVEFVLLSEVELLGSPLPANSPPD